MIHPKKGKSSDSKIRTIQEISVGVEADNSLIQKEQIEVTGLYTISKNSQSNLSPPTVKQSPIENYSGLLADLEGTGKIMLDKIAPRQDSSLTLKKIENLPGNPDKKT